MNASQGIIYGLDKENYKNVLFNVDEPGLFSDAKKTGKTIYNNYNLINRIMVMTAALTH